MAKVLIVDDAAFMRKTLALIFQQNGYEIGGEAENGTQAVTRYKELKPDLVTMDITMPEMDGIQAIKAIKAYDPDCRIIVISAMGQESMVREAVLSGAKGFIVKPFKEDVVISTAKKVLG